MGKEKGKKRNLFRIYVRILNSFERTREKNQQREIVFYRAFVL